MVVALLCLNTTGSTNLVGHHVHSHNLGQSESTYIYMYTGLYEGHSVVEEMAELWDNIIH